LRSLEPREEEHRFEIWPQIEKVGRRDLAGHDRVPNVRVAKEIQQFAELSDAQPFDLVRAIS
jgi:hypothetical protein